MGNLIHRQILELRFSSQQAAQRWSPRFSELNRRIILPELERAFTNIPEDQAVRIERLEIDLGRLRPDDLETDLTTALRQKIHAALQPHLRRQTSATAALEIPASKGEDRADSTAQDIDADSLDELFAQFLLSGQLPWWLKRELATQLDRLYRRFWRLAPDSARKLILQTIAEPLGLLRFIEQLSNRSHQITIQELLPPGSGTLLVDLRKLAVRLLARQGVGPQARLLSLKLVYSLILSSAQQTLERPQALARQFFFALARISGIPASRLREEVDAAVARSRITSATRAVLAELLREADSFAERRGKERSGFHTAAEELEQAKAAGTLEVAIENAGLVLLWPHLNQLFGKLELLETLADGSRRPRIEAALLLQQLVTGRPAGQENLLLLNKLLCGMPAAAPIPRRRPKRPWDDEVAALLTAVIKQWSVLKNTSVDGLRSSFLQREGILREQGDGWLLQVERKAHDILLEQLPWGLGMIQFSWMRQPLRIEW